MAVNKKLLAKRLTFMRSASFPKESVALNWHDYCGSTSIHGVKYVVEPKRPYIERIFWILVLGVCLAVNGYFVKKTWYKYNEGPPEPFNVLDIPFPAITICNDMKLKRSLFEKLNKTDEGNYRLGSLDAVLELSDLDVEDIGGGYDEFNSSDVEFLIKATPSLGEMTYECEVEFSTTSHIENELCNFMFTRVITDLGVCFSFNALSVQNLFRGYGNPWNKDHGILSNWTVDRIVAERGFSIDDRESIMRFPLRTYGAGKLFGISVVLKVLRSDVMMSRWGETMEGFKVLLHSPQDFPLMGQPSIFVPPNREVTTMILPRISTTAPSLKSYSPDVRRCYYSDEKLLAFFKIYSQNNCELECLVNHTLSFCGCVGLHMPRYESTPVCAPTSRYCLIESELTVALKLNKRTECDCLPSCNSIQYDSVTRQADFRSKAWAELNETGYDGSKLVVFFRESKFQANERREVVSYIDFLASCGGLLGLFSGMSIISFCEIFYYLTFRLWANARIVKEKLVVNRVKPTAAEDPVANKY